MDDPGLSVVAALGRRHVAIASIAAPLGLAAKIGRGISALRAGRAVTWVYALHASINGAHVATSVMIGLERGEIHELPLEMSGDPKAIVDAVLRMHPHAAVGFDAATLARFADDPRSARRLTHR